MKKKDSIISKLIRSIVVVCLIFSLIGLNLKGIYATNKSIDNNIGSEYMRILNEKAYRLEYADLIDFDADGNMELYLFYSSGEDSLTEEIWQLQNGKAINIFSNSQYANGSHFNFSGGRALCNRDGKVFLVEKCGLSAPNEVQDIEDSYWLNVLELKDNKIVEKIKLMEKIVTDIDINADYDYPERILYSAEITENGNKTVIPEKLLAEYSEYHDAKAIKIIDKYSPSDKERIIVAEPHEPITWKKNDLQNVYSKLMASMLPQTSYSFPQVKLSENEKNEIIDMMMLILNSRSSFDIANPNTKQLMQSDFAPFIPISLFGEYFKDKFNYEVINYPNDSNPVEVFSIEKSAFDKLMKSYIGTTLPIKEVNGKYIFELEPAVGDNWNGIGDILTFYDLGNGIYYTQFITLEYAGYWEGNNTIDTAILQKTIENGVTYWKVLRYDLGGKELNQEAISRYIPKGKIASKIALDYNKLSFQEGKNAIKNAISSSKGELNSADLYDLARYAEAIVENNNKAAIESEENSIVFDSNMFKETISSINKDKNELNDLFQKENIRLFRNIQNNLRVDVLNIDLNLPINIKFKEKFLKNSDGIDTIDIFLGDTNFGISINPKSLLDTNEFNIEIRKQNDSTFIINYLDDNNPIDKLESPFTIFLPSDSNKTNVLINENVMPSIFDGQNKTVRFESYFSGEYKLALNNDSVNDIEKLNKYEQEAIGFGILRSYFSADEKNNFNPDKLVTSEEINKIFSNEIINSNNITKEDFVTLSIKKLLSSGKYSIDELIQTSDFIDKGSIRDENKQYIELAVQLGIIDNGGVLSPLSEISRKEAACILYETVKKYNEIPNYKLALSESITIEKSSLPGKVIYIVGVAGIVLAILYIIYAKKRKNN